MARVIADSCPSPPPPISELQEKAAKTLGVERTLFVPTNTMANLISGEHLPAPLSWGLWHWWAHAWISFGCSHWSTPNSVVGGVRSVSLCHSLAVPPECLPCSPGLGCSPVCLCPRFSDMAWLLLIPWAACSWSSILALFLAGHGGLMQVVSVQPSQ